MRDLTTPRALWDEAEQLGIEELRDLQLARLRDMLQRAYTGVPHYRFAFDEAGVHPDDLCAPDDLAQFPFTTQAA